MESSFSISSIWLGDVAKVSGSNMLRVSLCLIARNEEKALPLILNDFKEQDYPHELIEIVLVDSGSTDLTRDIMELFQVENTSFMSVHVHDNPGLIQAAGWNVAIKASAGDVIIRIDAHSHIPSDFISKNMMWIHKGEAVVGGRRPCTIVNPTQWQETLLTAENSVFGSSIAPYRRGTQKPTYVKSVFHGAYRRGIFEEVGGFDEDLGRTEDNEIHYRIRKNNYQIRFDPEIISYQFARLTLKKTLKQKYGNGYWVGRTLTYCPQCLSWYHFIPLLFLLSLIFSAILAILQISLRPFLLIISMYIVVTSIAAAFGVRERGYFCWSDLLLLPIMFGIHLLYGIGTMIGLLLPIKRIKKKKKLENTDQGARKYE